MIYFSLSSLTLYFVSYHQLSKSVQEEKREDDSTSLFIQRSERIKFCATLLNFLTLWSRISLRPSSLRILFKLRNEKIGSKKGQLSYLDVCFFFFFFLSVLSLTNLFNNVPIKTVLEANVKCHAAVRWNLVTSILAAPNNFFSRKSSVHVRTTVFVCATRISSISGAGLSFFSNFSFTRWTLPNY